ncbi:Ribosomal RNA-processing protein 1 [Intoshia linei]|uniref:Ribosomal RNA-processing protein 1 n=1 Tax=Intoshia linei TaxID=1819745 RepID=A0A177B9R6_9BILA|nr:Ribosomal RNA-processing protein 1 [Intoshia linei]
MNEMQKLCRKLSSNEEKIRLTTINTLKDTLQFSKLPIHDGCLKYLCSGLFFTLWMQDKPILQQELVDSICEIISKSIDSNIFTCKGWTIQFFTVLSCQWNRIDYLRIDKFMMYVRRVYKTLFSKYHDVCTFLDDIFSEILVDSVTNRYINGLISHTIDIVAEELAIADLEHSLVMEIMNTMLQFMIKSKQSYQLIGDHFFCYFLDDNDGLTIDSDKFTTLFNEISESELLIPKKQKYFKSLAEKIENTHKKINYNEIKQQLLPTIITKRRTKKKFKKNK